MLSIQWFCYSEDYDVSQVINIIKRHIWKGETRQIVQIFFCTLNLFCSFE